MDKFVYSLFILITAIQGLIIILQQITHSKERKDLYNRLMARDLTEYRQEPIKIKPVKNIIRKNMQRKTND